MRPISDEEDLSGVLARMQGVADEHMKSASPLSTLEEESSSEAPNQDVWRLYMKKRRAGAILSQQMKEGGFEDLMKRAKFRRVTDRGEEE